MRVVFIKAKQDIFIAHLLKKFDKLGSSISILVLVTDVKRTFTLVDQWEIINSCISSYRRTLHLNSTDDVYL